MTVPSAVLTISSALKGLTLFFILDHAFNGKYNCYDKYNQYYRCAHAAFPFPLNNAFSFLAGLNNRYRRTSNNATATTVPIPNVPARNKEPSWKMINAIT